MSPRTTTLPKLLKSLADDPPVQVTCAGNQPSIAWTEDLCRQLADAVHALVNSTVRHAGVDVSNTDSEGTWTWCQDLAMLVQDYIAKGWEARVQAQAQAEREGRQAARPAPSALLVNLAERVYRLEQILVRLPGGAEAERQAAADGAAAAEVKAAEEALKRAIRE